MTFKSCDPECKNVMTAEKLLWAKKLIEEHNAQQEPFICPVPAGMWPTPIDVEIMERMGWTFVKVADPETTGYQPLPREIPKKLRRRGQKGRG